MNDELKRNGSGYYDPTAWQATKNIITKQAKVAQVIKTIQSVAHLAGFQIEGRIILFDKETGEVWK